MDNRILIIHGWKSNAGAHWYPSAKKAFEQDGFEVSIPDMPHSDYPIKAEWVRVINAFSPDEHSILIGHSLGGTAILRYMEYAQKEVSHCFIIASPLWSIGHGEIDNFFVPVFDWQKIRSLSKKFSLLYQEGDKSVPIEHGKELARQLGVPLMSATGDDHFDSIDVEWLKQFVLT